MATSRENGNMHTIVGGVTTPSGNIIHMPAMPGVMRPAGVATTPMQPPMIGGQLVGSYPAGSIPQTFEAGPIHHVVGGVSSLPTGTSSSSSTTVTKHTTVTSSSSALGGLPQTFEAGNKHTIVGGLAGNGLGSLWQTQATTLPAGTSTTTVYPSVVGGLPQTFEAGNKHTIVGGLASHGIHTSTSVGPIVTTTSGKTTHIGPDGKVTTQVFPPTTTTYPAGSAPSTFPAFAQPSTVTLPSGITITNDVPGAGPLQPAPQL